MTIVKHHLIERVYEEFPLNQCAREAEISSRQRVSDTDEHQSSARVQRMINTESPRRELSGRSASARTRIGPCRTKNTVRSSRCIAWRSSENRAYRVKFAIAAASMTTTRVHEDADSTTRTDCAARRSRRLRLPVRYVFARRFVSVKASRWRKRYYRSTVQDRTG
jgi:hypothetical protein